MVHQQLALYLTSADSRAEALIRGKDARYTPARQLVSAASLNIQTSPPMLSGLTFLMSMPKSLRSNKLTFPLWQALSCHQVDIFLIGGKS